MQYHEASNFIRNQLNRSSFLAVPEKYRFTAIKGWLDTRKVIMALEGCNNLAQWQALEDDSVAAMDIAIVQARIQNGYEVPEHSRNIVRDNYRKTVTASPEFQLPRQAIRQAGEQVVIACALGLSIVTNQQLLKNAIAAEVFRKFVHAFSRIPETVLAAMRPSGFDDTPIEMQDELLLLCTAENHSLARFMRSIANNTDLIEYEKIQARRKELQDKADRVLPKALRMAMDMGCVSADRLRKEYDF